jgi:hypothetical protein
MSVEHKSLRDEILFVIGRASAPLSSGEIYERCDLADEMKQVSNALFQLHAAEKITRNKDDGKLTYTLNKGVSAPAPAGKAGRPAAVEIPVLGTPAEKPKEDPVAQGLDLVEMATDPATRINAERLADALLEKTRAQLAKPAPAVRWRIDQDGGIEILCGEDAVMLGRDQAERMAVMLMASFDALDQL